MPKILIPSSEYELTAIRGAGPGGQHVNKVATAIQLRFDVHDSSLKPRLKARILAYQDKRISKEGIILIRAAEFKSQVKNREAAVRRLHELLEKATFVPKKRKATKVPRSVKEKRMKDKAKRSAIKKNRGKVRPDD